MNRRQGRGTFRQKPLVVEIHKEKKGFWRGFFSFMQRFFMGLGVLFFISIIGYGYLIASFLEGAKPTLPEQVVLVHNFSGSLDEMQGAPSLIGGSKSASFVDLIESLNKAAEDPQVKGFVARVSANSISSAQLHDIGQSLEKFREAGKFTYAYSDSIGETGNGMNEYLLASLFDEVWVQPIGSVAIMGYNLESPFFRGLLDRFGVKPQFFQREEYKSAMESLTRSNMSPEAKRETQALLKDIADSYVTKIAQARELPVDIIKQAIDQAPLTVDQALEIGLIDRVDFVDKLLALVKAKAGLSDADEQMLTLAKYMQTKEDVLDIGNTGLGDVMGKKSSHPKVAVISMEGPIISGSSTDEGYSPFSNNKIIYSRDYAGLIKTAADEEDVKAIIIRISSPGGSPTASEAIRRALVYAKEEKKKSIVLSMGAVAASGGYWIASAADHIYATETTITGSIGVISGKLVLGDALSAYGITSDSVQYGDNADFLSPFRTFDEKGEARINALLDQIYDGFLNRVAEGRNMDVAAVRKIAGGRVWSGKAAAENGLVDTIGGLQDAQNYTAQQLDVAVTDIDFVHYPKRKSLIEQITLMLSGDWAMLPSWLQGIITQFLTTVKVQENSPVQVLYNP